MSRSRLVARCIHCGNPATDPNDTARLHPADGSLTATGHCPAHADLQRWQNERTPDDGYDWGCAYCGWDEAQCSLSWDYNGVTGEAWYDINMSDRETNTDLYIDWDAIREYCLETAKRHMPHMFNISEDLNLDAHPNIYDNVWDEVREAFFESLNLRDVYCGSCESAVPYDFA